jgi:hypothetical protein
LAQGTPQGDALVAARYYFSRGFDSCAAHRCAGTYSSQYQSLVHFQCLPFRQRPYCDEYTRSHPNSEVKHRKARSVLGWGTAWEALRVPLAFINHNKRIKIIIRFAKPELFWRQYFRQRPYCDEYTRSHPNSEVKHRKARSVLGWGTAWEALRVPLAFINHNKRFQIIRNNYARIIMQNNYVFHPLRTVLFWRQYFRQRPYCDEYTRSHPNSEVKHRKARSVLGWGTAWEALRVPLAFINHNKRLQTI